MQYITKHIGRKFSLLITGMMIIIISIAVAWLTFANRERSLLQMEQSSILVEELIQSIVYRPMMAGDDEETRNEFEFLAKNNPQMQMYMSSFLDKVTYSTEKSIERKSISQADIPLPVIEEAQKAIKKDIHTSNLSEYNGKWYFSKITSIKNEKDCYHCHGSSQSILGQFTVINNVTPLITELTNFSYKTVGMGVATVILMIILVNIFVSKVIVTRLNKIRDISTEVSKGNLDANFSVSGTDEFFTLSENIGKMVQHLKKEMGFSKSVLSGMSVPYLIIDTDTRVTACNKAILEAFGTDLSPKDCSGTLLSNFTSQVGIGLSILTRVLSTEEDLIDIPLHFKNLKGVDKYFLITSSALYDLDHKLIGAFAIGVDITTIKEQENHAKLQSYRIKQNADSAREVSYTVADNSTLLSEQVSTAQSAALEILAQTQESVSACEQIQASLVDVSEKAVHASQLAENATAEANNGRKVVEEAVQCIDNVMGEVNSLVESMTALKNQTTEITNIISVIDEIADQTNLLALNAAIEAARAGDAGRGFAVVADEVRKLAEKTQEATKHVNTSINSIIQDISNTTEGTNKTLNLMETATDFSKQSGDALHKIHAMIQDTAKNISIMAEEAKGQINTVENMSDGVGIINSISTNTVDSMSVATNAVKELDTTVQRLNEIIDRMK